MGCQTSESTVMQLLFVVLLVLVLVLCSSVEGRKLWGARKKSAGSDDTAPPVPPRRERINPVLDAESLATFTNVLTQYLDAAEVTLDGPDFDLGTVRDTLEKMKEYLPAGDLPEEFQELDDPERVRQAAKKGFAMLRENMDTINAVLQDPQQFAELMNMIPPELTQMLELIGSGDVSAIKTIVDNLPGLDASQKSMMQNLLSGNTEAALEEAKSSLEDPSNIEQARLQMLENVEMAKALGFSEEVLNDPVKWRELVSEGLGMIGNDGSTEVVQPAPKRKVSRARAA